MNANSFWNTPAQKHQTESTNSNFNSFANFFPTSKNEVKPQTSTSNDSNSDMYDFFFAPETKPTQNIPPKVQSNTSQNLLDL